MPVVTLREILKNAGREKYAVGMFDVHHSDMAEAVLEAAEERNAPVILEMCIRDSLKDRAGRGYHLQWK